MLIRGLRRLIAVLGPVLVLLVFVVGFYDERLIGSLSHFTENVFSINRNGQHSRSVQDLDLQEDVLSDFLGRTKNVSEQHPAQEDNNNVISETHHEVFSASRADKAYFPVEFGHLESQNPNFIPHPHLNDTWIMVAQQQKSNVENSVWCAELVCDAVFKKDGALGCVKPPLILPIAATKGGNCKGNIDYYNLNVGPHDARVFYGPSAPYAIYGSNSGFTCFGQWMLDFRMLVDWGLELAKKDEFRQATELQRPLPYGTMEKNWFLFWDSQGSMYAHYDVAPKRVFAKLESDGSAGENLAPLAAFSDDNCMVKYMPTVGPSLESIHQATNSLSITLCKRSDLSCVPTDYNTFILTIFQHKSFYDFHPVYEPYVMLFKQTAPFEIHGISQKPIWIHGRGKAGDKGKGSLDGPALTAPKPLNHTDMFYLTSLSWKAHGQKYHGYTDDVVLIGFGIEDSRAAGIDVVAGDLIEGLGLCATL